MSSLFETTRRSLLLAARSMREIQQRADYTQNVAAGALVATFCVILLFAAADLLAKN